MKLFYRKMGDGQPVIILHGIFGISDNWVSIGRRIAEQYEVFILDQRNHGQSPHSDTFNYFALADDLYEFIEDHQIINPILIGHSMGGKVAMNFALDNPARVEKLIVVDISLREYSARQEHMDIIHAMMSVNFDEINSREDVETIVSRSVKSERIRLFIMKNLYRIGQKRFAWRMNVPAIYENVENVFIGVESSYTYDKPALFIKGGASDYILESDFDAIRQRFPAAQFQTIEGASHWVHADKPDALCEVLSGFLEKAC